MTWKDISYILSSPLSKKILEVLNKNSPLVPHQIAKESNIARGNVSTKLSELRKRRLVECINQESRKWRFYRITKDGKRTLIEIGKMKW